MPAEEKAPWVEEEATQAEEQPEEPAKKKPKK